MTAKSKELVKRMYDKVPSVQIHQAEGEVALLILTIPETQASEGAALVRKDVYLHKPIDLLDPGPKDLYFDRPNLKRLCLNRFTAHRPSASNPNNVLEYTCKKIL
jgi:hypothetical protein